MAGERVRLRGEVPMSILDHEWTALRLSARWKRTTARRPATPTVTKMTRHALSHFHSRRVQGAVFLLQRVLVPRIWAGDLPAWPRARQSDIQL